MIHIILEDGQEVSVPKGTTLEQILEDLSSQETKVDNEPKSPALLAVVNGKLRELWAPLNADANVRFLTLEHQDGYRTYIRTLNFLFLYSAEEVLGKEAEVRIKQAISGGTYCEISRGERTGVTEEETQALLEAMRRHVAEDLPIRKKPYPIDEAMDLFEARGMWDRSQVFKYRRFSTINLYSLGGMIDYFYGYMLPSTGMLKYFDLTQYREGVIIQLPERKWPHKVRPFVPSEKLFDVFRRSTEWSEIMGVETIGALNDSIADGSIHELIEISEALHAGHIAAIAREIFARRDQIRMVLIAGPSSSGKTTFAKKLSIQLRAEGLRPRMISVDDYFVNRENTPLDENGEKDYESLYAIDIEAFNSDLKALMAGETVTLPRYNFVTGLREYHEKPMQMGPDDILVIEGIHCLNEALTAQITRSEKYKIYISALTLINVDDHNRIPTTDGRLLRRMVRDHQYRGASAARTISMWPQVRAGEERNIFPFQEEADVMFNSAHIYELAVIKQYAEPLLFSIRRDEPEYAEARRLIKFLDYCLGVSSEIVPSTSIIREFIGGYNGE
ncbi:MAG: nucleoside kinase [Clostridiales bacterium]|nr:nucleoside kinase [Clostridiales bacterium]